METFTHLDSKGRARMVDIGAKGETERTAQARGQVRMNADVVEKIRGGGLPKGDALAVARVAAILAAKRTDEIIPLCHPLNLSSVEIRFRLETDAVIVFAEVKTLGRTGAEMEALTAVSAAALTLYDMCKSMDRKITIGPVALVSKSGGRSGDFVNSYAG